jgi:hypothetical protein
MELMAEERVGDSQLIFSRLTPFLFALGDSDVNLRFESCFCPVEIKLLPLAICLTTTDSIDSGDDMDGSSSVLELFFLVVSVLDLDVTSRTCDDSINTSWKILLLQF